MFPRRRERPLALGILLLLQSQTHLFGTVLAVGILALIVLDAFSDPAAREQLRRPAVLGGLGLALSGALLAALHVAVQASGIGSAHLGVYQPAYDLAWLGSCLSTVARGFLPLPVPGDPGLWNSNLLDSLSPLAGGALGLALLSGPALAGDTSRPDNAQLYIIWPKDGRAIPGGKLWLRLGLKNFGVAPAGIERANTGHHHVIINAPLPCKYQIIINIFYNCCQGLRRCQRIAPFQRAIANEDSLIGPHGQRSSNGFSDPLWSKAYDSDLTTEFFFQL